MIRKMLLATTVIAAMLLSVLSFGALTAEAQGEPTCSYTDFTKNGLVCAKALAYPGPFTNMPTTPGGPYGWGHLGPVAGAGAAVTVPVVGGTGGGLAHTGGESAVLVYAGAGLIAFGAVALGSRRKFFQGALED